MECVFVLLHRAMERSFLLLLYVTFRVRRIIVSLKRRIMRQGRH